MMNRVALLRKWLVLAGIGTIAALLNTACSTGGPIERHWTEDVSLDDGSTIVVRRTVEFNESNSLSGDAYNAVETNATITFTGSLASLPTWSAPLMALLLYRNADTSEWTIVATSTSCEVWNLRGEPPTLYWEYRLDAKAWRETSLSAASIGRATNLLHRYQEKLGTNHITVAARRQRESDSRIGKEFQQVVGTRKAHCDHATNIPTPSIASKFLTEPKRK
jgi:hypothetical protein